MRVRGGAPHEYLAMRLLGKMAERHYVRSITQLAIAIGVLLHPPWKGREDSAEVRSGFRILASKRGQKRKLGADHH